MPLITYTASYFGHWVLHFRFEDIEIVQTRYFTKDIYYLSLAGRYPIPSFCIIMALISFLAMIIVPWIKQILKPVTIWIFLVSLINLVSSLFFIFCADKFPYSLDIFSDLYIKTEINMWLVIPFLMSMAFLPIPSKLFSKLLVILLTLCYSITLGIMRYIIFVYVLRKFTYLFMAMLFFIFGPLLDFVYIIGIYSIYISIVAQKMKQDKSVWKWLY